jgi:hypothetical protein
MFWKIIHALLAFLEDSASDPLTGRDAAKQLVVRLLNEEFNFRALYEQEKNAYRYGLIVHNIRLEGRPKLLIEEAGLSCIPPEWWIHSILTLHKQNSDGVRELLTNHDFLYENVKRQARQSEDPKTIKFTLNSLASFYRALIQLLDQDNDFAPFKKVIPDLCAFIVKNEHENFEEQKYYLERLLNNNEAPATKFKRLERLVREMGDDVRQDKATNGSHLMKIIGPISDYYLKQYDLDRAAGFWDFVEKKDWLLSFILSFYRSPLRYVLYAILFMVLIGASKLINDFSVTGIVHKISSWLAAGLLGLVPALVLAALILLLGRFLKRSGLDYIELFMPRLLGAVIVGLSILLLEDITWKIGLQIDWRTLIVVCIAIYELSFIYIFIDVHKTLRLLPLPPEQKNRKPIGRSIKASVRVFLIGCCGAFLAVLFSSGLLYQAALSSDPKFFDLIAGRLILKVEGANVFGFFPKLVILWTGLTLFIGAFVQLIWQDRRITSPL